MGCFILGMRLTYPGGFLTFIGIATIAALAFALYEHWQVMVWIFAPLALCHVGLFLRIRLAAWALLVAYAAACVFVLLAFYLKWSFAMTPAKLGLRLALNASIAYELYQWLRRDAISVRY